MRAISTLSLECGTSTFWCRALMALRTRVKKSETGSVRLMLYISSNRRSLALARTVRASASSTLGKEPAATDYLTTLHQLLATALPTRLHDPGNLALQGQTASALPRPTSRPNGASNKTTRTTENIAYQSSRSVKKTHLPAGVLRKMSLAVLVDQIGRA